ncbi:MAG: proteasome assembly chaperone family protein [Acidimicrobiales bacterium]
MSELFEMHGRPDLADPVLVLALDGWIDAGFGAAVARRALLDAAGPTTLIATFDRDRLLDFRARRPTMHIEVGEVTSMSWPSIELRAAVDPPQPSMLYLVGAEPDHAWGAFCDAVVDLAGQLGVRIVVGLGAYPTPVPHTRPSRLAATLSTPELGDGRPYLLASIDVPAGVQTAVEQACAEAGIPAIGLWAQVPHYVVSMEYPGAAAALVDGLADLTGLRIDATPLLDEAATLRQRLDELVEANPEHLTMVRRLEEQYDAEAVAPNEQGLAGGRLPTADELVAEVERYLREQGGA